MDPNSQTAFLNGSSAWSHSLANVEFYPGTGNYNSPQTYKIENVSGNGQDGVTYIYTDSAGFITHTDTYLNVAYTGGYSAAKRQSVVTHELGHVLGLGHSSSSNCSVDPVMDPFTSHRWDTCQINTPKSDDIDGVNVLY